MKKIIDNSQKKQDFTDIEILSESIVFYSKHNDTVSDCVRHIFLQLLILLKLVNNKSGIWQSLTKIISEIVQNVTEEKDVESYRDKSYNINLSFDTRPKVNRKKTVSGEENRAVNKKKEENDGGEAIIVDEEEEKTRRGRNEDGQSKNKNRDRSRSPVKRVKDEYKKNLPKEKITEFFSRKKMN